MQGMVRCFKCGCPNPQGRTTCYKCSALLDPGLIHWKGRSGNSADALVILSWIFAGLAAVAAMLTILACFDLSDLIQWLNREVVVPYGPPLPMSRLVLLTFAAGFLFSAYLYAISRALLWMAAVRDYLQVIACSQGQEPAEGSQLVP